MDSDLIICTCIIGFTAISLWILVTCIADKVKNRLFVYYNSNNWTYFFIFFIIAKHLLKSLILELQ